MVPEESGGVEWNNELRRKRMKNKMIIRKFGWEYCGHVGGERIMTKENYKYTKQLTFCNGRRGKMKAKT